VTRRGCLLIAGGILGALLVVAPLIIF